MIKHVNEENFKNEIGKGRVLVDFLQLGVDHAKCYHL